jgi:type IV pilus assembly protein PilX
MNAYQHSNKEFSPSGNSGLALFISLVMLLILTILGVSAVQTTSVQERMARNARDTSLAFQAAESALRDAEIYLETLIALTDFDVGGEANGFYTTAACFPVDCTVADNPGQSGYYVTIPVGTDFKWRLVDWDGTAVIDGSAMADVADTPKYLIEYQRAVVTDTDTLNLDNIGMDTGAGRVQLFRVITYGTGGTARSHVTLQGTYGKIF